MLSKHQWFRMLVDTVILSNVTISKPYSELKSYYMITESGKLSK